MRLLSLEVENYRNIASASLTPGRELTVICGNNGQGKTNLLEAIWLLTGGKSFRGGKDAELVRRGEPFAVLKASTLRAQQEEQEKEEPNRVRLTVGAPDSPRPGRTVSVNGGAVKRAASLAGSFPAVVFDPGHLSLVKGAPEGRRKFLDAALCQLYPGYLTLYRRYVRALQQKNALLRRSSNGVERPYAEKRAGAIVITDEKVTERLQQNPLAYDKDGEMHYDIISAFIKSIRGSDPDGALYWLARMVEGGEDPAFIARRLVISAAEDIGLANPNALLLANTAFDAVMKIGWPEGRIPLAEATVYLATSPKSNSAYEGINSALELVRSTGNLPVPLHLRNAPTKLMKQLGYGKDYKYAHAYQGNFVNQQFLPDEIKNSRIWHPQNNAQEVKLKERMQGLWGDKFKE